MPLCGRTLAFSNLDTQAGNTEIVPCVMGHQPNISKHMQAVAVCVSASAYSTSVHHQVPANGCCYLAFLNLIFIVSSAGWCNETQYLGLNASCHVYHQ